MEDSWFKVENIDNDTFVISEYKHWEKTHCYLLLGLEKAILIDTGLGVANIKKIIDSLTKLPVMVITTHTHWDHIGGHKYFNEVGVHEEEVEWISKSFPLSLDMVKCNLLREKCDFPKDFDIDTYCIFKGEPTYRLKDGSVIDIGGRKITILHTPGHSPGHICVYEKGRGYLFCGDLIYKGCLDAFYPSTDPMDFMKSVNKISSLEVNKVLPAHYSLDISVDIIKEIDDAFKKLYIQGMLKHGSGIFTYENFSIHI